MHLSTAHSPMRIPGKTGRLFFLLVLAGCHAQPINSDRDVQSTADLASAGEDQAIKEITPVEPPPPALFDSPLPLETPALPAGLSHLGSDGCKACHWEVTETWKGSIHAGVASPALAQAISAADDAPECSRCHLPLQVQHRRLIAPSTDESLVNSERVPNPTWSPSLQAEGVGCVACHVRDGVILGSRDLNAPHPVRKSTELLSSEGCAGCHQFSWEGADLPIYDTYGEWSRSTYAEVGLQCQDCHMAPVLGSATPGGRPTHADHRFDARHGEGLSLHLTLPPEGVTRGSDLIGSLRVQNTGAGHAIPTGSPFKTLVIALELLDNRGKIVGKGAEFRFSRTVEKEAPYNTISDNRLQVGADEQMDFSFKIPYRARSGASTFRARVFVEHATGKPSEDWLIQEIPFPVY
jgi:hypothetical protein